MNSEGSLSDNDEDMEIDDILDMSSSESFDFGTGSLQDFIRDDSVESMSNSSASDEDEIQYDDTTSSSDENISEPPSEPPSMEPTPSTAELQQPITSMIQQSSTSMIGQQSTSECVPTPQKNDVTENRVDDSLNSDEEAFSCTICLESLNNTGHHRPACLKCGHIFGYNCLERWIQVGYKNGTRRCPTCNTKASYKDIRVLYAKQLIAVDTAQITALETKLQQEIREKTRIMVDVDKLKVKNEYLCDELEKLRSIIENNKSGTLSTNGQSTIRECIKKLPLSKIGGCRVMAFNKTNMMMVVSQKSESQLFSNSHIIRKLNASILESSKDCIYAHSKQIRDMAFHPTEPNLLASVSLDKHVKLIDMVSNTAVSFIDVEEALWSCCWAGDNPNHLIFGGQMGSLFFADRRFMILKGARVEQKYPCVSLLPLPPSSSRSFINGGFLKTRMDNISVFEPFVGQPRYGVRHKVTELPLKGHWSSCSYDSRSNLLLTSSKPCGTNKSVRHIISKISDYNVEGPSLNPVVTFFGGDKATQLSRSCIVPSFTPSEDSIVCGYDEKSKSVKLFSIDSGCNVHNFQVKENILDLCPFTGVNGLENKRVVAGLSENSLHIFTV